MITHQYEMLTFLTAVYDEVTKFDDCKHNYN